MKIIDRRIDFGVLIFTVISDYFTLNFYLGSIQGFFDRPSLSFVMGVFERAVGKIVKLVSFLF